jgi:hypothetical protein
MVRCFATVDRDRSANQVNRLGVPALGMGNDPQQMQAVGVVRIDCQATPVKPLRVLDASGLMVLHSGSEDPRYGGHLTRSFAHRLFRTALFAVHRRVGTAMTRGKLLTGVGVPL